MEFKICDIGSGVALSETSRPTQFRSVVGTPSYLSPELFALNENKARFGVYDPFKSDVYSLGLCILSLVSFETITGNQRFSILFLFYSSNSYYSFFFFFLFRL